jgi:hypothetical protein
MHESHLFQQKQNDKCMMKKIILLGALTTSFAAISPSECYAHLFSSETKPPTFFKANISLQNPINVATEKTIRAISYSECIVELEDGIKLFVRPSDSDTLKAWRPGMQIHIKQNDLWGSSFSSYYFLLVDQVTNKWVKANLPKPPFEETHKKRVIQCIFPERGLIFLDDGIIFTYYYGWRCSWEVGDEILIGTNCQEHYSDSNRKLLLINATKNDYAPASYCNLDVDIELLKKKIEVGSP